VLSYHPLNDLAVLVGKNESGYMSPDLMHWPLGFLAALVVAGTARKRRSLSVDGTVAAIALGTVLVGAAGWWAGTLIVAFFASSSVLSHARKANDIDQARGAERDAVQVLANGGVPLLAVVLFAITGHGTWMTLLAGSIAAVNADTWSTEIGRTSRSLPRLITSGKTVPAGTSGAVSRRGLLAALGGAALIGALAWVGWRTGWFPGADFTTIGMVSVIAGGVAGSLVDSLLGATIQDQRWCDVCGKRSEARVHRCGTLTRPIRGIRQVNNDVVNLSCGATGAIVAWLLVQAFA
jgi:uncharacterized protein (TIGR00297 family)